MMQSTLFGESAAERIACRLQGRLSHRQRLAARLGDGRDWEYTGQCDELPKPTGTCTCGHSGLKFLFHIRNAKSNEECIVGSSCIECYRDANPDMVNAITAALDAKLAEAAEQRRKARELAQSVEVEAALARYAELAYALDEVLATGAEPFTYRDWSGHEQSDFRRVRRVSNRIFRRWHTPEVAARRIADRQEAYPHRWKQYKRKADFLRAIKAEITNLEEISAGPIWDAGPVY